jgi:hypothetical protein
MGISSDDIEAASEFASSLSPEQVEEILRDFLKIHGYVLIIIL